MSMVLRKTDRDELVKQLENCLMISHKSSKVVIVFRNRKNNTVVKVEETEHGVFLVPFESGSGLIKIAPLMGSRMKEMSVEELVCELKKCSAGDVFIEWPTENPHIVVGKVFGIAQGDCLSVCLWPVPKDIDRINEDVRKICARKCRAAKLGLQCGDCPKLGSCDIIAEADKEISEIENERNK